MLCDIFFGPPICLAAVYRVVRGNFTRSLAKYKVRGMSAVMPNTDAGGVAANSERIAARFGSCGIEVLSQTTGIRRSSLYSDDGTQKVCRTYAVVQFEDEATPQVATAHADIIAGQSIGATFKSTGWQIRKTTLFLGSLPPIAPAHPIGSLMQLDQENNLAVHVYRLILERASQSINYATIVEVHHPDYLSVDELQLLYGSNMEFETGTGEVAGLLRLVLDSD